MHLSSIALLAFSLFTEISASEIHGRKLSKSNKQSKRTKKMRRSTPAFGCVFTMTNELNTNRVIMYSRNLRSGALTVSPNSQQGLTGGSGGPELGGNANDPYGAQDLLIIAGKCVIAVNAGSDNISSFEIMSETVITIRSTAIPSGGKIPVSIAERDGVVYVLNVGGDGSISGFNLNQMTCKLTSIPDSTFPLDQAPRKMDPAVPELPALLSTPTQIGFTPNGEFLLVAIKGIRGHTEFGGTIAQFVVNQHTGMALPNPNMLPIGTDSSLPFSFDFDNRGNLLIVDAFGTGLFGSGTSTVFSFTVRSNNLKRNDRITLDGQFAGCWVKYSNGCAYTTNNPNHSVSGVTVSTNGLSNAIVAAQGGGASALNNPLDLNFSFDGNFLYVLSTNNNSTQMPAIHGYKRNAINCNLEEVEVETALPNEPTNANTLSIGVVGLAVL